MQVTVPNPKTHESVVNHEHVTGEGGNGRLSEHITIVAAGRLPILEILYLPETKLGPLFIAPPKQ